MELQFYPPGSPFDRLSFSSSSFNPSGQWAVNMPIFSFTGNNNCFEPVSSAPITTNGATNGALLGLNPGDQILVLLQDTTNGLQATVTDQTTSQTGHMVASSANGFVNTNPVTCARTPFSFHPEYSTALFANTVRWTALSANINIAFEIGHGELTQSGDSDADDQTGGVNSCFPMYLACYNGGDTDTDGFSYLNDWPDGTANHPSTLSLAAPLSSASNQYAQIQFKTEQGCFKSPATCTFYPFWSTLGNPGTSCFNFGNDLPGTTNDFTKDSQYLVINSGVPTGPTMDNPCAPPLSVSKFFTDEEGYPLQTDSSGNPVVDVNIEDGVVEQTNPDELLVWLKVTNTGTTSVQSMQITDTLPVDWSDEVEGVFFMFTDGTQVDITKDSSATTSAGNPQTVSVSIDDLTATAAAKTLDPDESILVSIEISYNLVDTSVDPSSYPINYVDTATATAWDQASFTGTRTDGAASAFFTAQVALEGDVDNDGSVSFTDIAYVAFSYGAKPGDSNWRTPADINGDGVINILDLAETAYLAYLGTHT